MSDSDDGSEFDVGEYAKEHTSDILAFFLGLFMLRFFLRVWQMVPPSSLLGGIVVLFTLSMALLLFVAAVSGIDTMRWGTHLSLGAGLGMAGAGIVLWWHISQPYVGPDVLLFTQYAGELVLEGQNPYTHSMLPPIRESMNASGQGALTAFVTPNTSGGTVSMLSYPAGATLVFLPQLATELGHNEGLLTLMLPAFGLMWLVIRASPPGLAFLGLGALILPRNVLISSIGGLNDILYVLPVVVAMLYWYDERYLAAAVAMGIAASMKQQAWFILPFLGYWLLVDNDSWTDGFKSATRFGSIVAGVFTLINLPFIISAPDAWLAGVFTPLRDGGAPLITQGGGLAIFTSNGIYTLPKPYYMLVFAGWMATLFGIYALYWDRLKWMAWITPGIILFANYRSLPTYFTYMAPLGYFAFLCATDLVWHHGNWWGHFKRPIREARA